MAAQHTIYLANTDEHYRCAEDRDVLRAMESLGRRGIPVGCRGGGCGICKVRIKSGAHTARKMSRAFVSAAEEADGVALACRIFPRADLHLEAIDTLARCVERSSRPTDRDPDRPPLR